LLLKKLLQRKPKQNLLLLPFKGTFRQLSMNSKKNKRKRKIEKKKKGKRLEQRKKRKDLIESKLGRRNKNSKRKNLQRK
jgi:hypothetical protein